MSLTERFDRNPEVYPRGQGGGDDVEGGHLAGVGGGAREVEIILVPNKAPASDPIFEETRF